MIMLFDKTEIRPQVKRKENSLISRKKHINLH